MGFAEAAISVGTTDACSATASKPMAGARFGAICSVAASDCGKAIPVAAGALSCIRNSPQLIPLPIQFSHCDLSTVNFEYSGVLRDIMWRLRRLSAISFDLIHIYLLNV